MPRSPVVIAVIAGLHTSSMRWAWIKSDATSACSASALLASIQAGSMLRVLST